ncbi:hypothetical protein PENTCL1PPCAC_11602 [Pristionchus entomophagus]|uniref:Uncharacterized protein n=1 Tax=Pristionchus entomophagus TaxID=358040 RepID=A0AAV5T1G6_9BILA|nr:hypothetical protein PENTCL1PPCAC_11602 [Pristionchus entomophagus]
MIYGEGLDNYGTVHQELGPTTSSSHEQDGRRGHAYRRERSIQESMMDMHNEQYHLNGDVHQQLRTVHHRNEVIGGEEELEEMQEIIDETGRPLFIRADGNMYHPDNLYVLDDDGSTVTWRLEMVDEDGSGVDMSGIAPLQMEQPLSFDVSAYEVCDSSSVSSSRPIRSSRGRHLTNQPRSFLPIPSHQTFTSIDTSTSSNNHGHAKVSRIDASKGKIRVKKTEAESRVGRGPSTSIPRSDLSILPPPVPLPKLSRRPTSRYTTQSTLHNATSGLETANCNYCHLRFYMPHTALRSRISYDETVSPSINLPFAFFECPICGMESASGPSSSRR